MPISIGALRPVKAPSFTSFNPFIKRLPPPRKFVFEPRQVLAGDVVDPYNYLRALFRGEVGLMKKLFLSFTSCLQVVLTSNKLPTFASPRVWNSSPAATTAAAVPASYTTRSPQGFNPWSVNKGSCINIDD